MYTCNVIDCIMAPKVIDYGTNRKRACNLLLLIHNKFGLILHRFRNNGGLKVEHYHFVPTLLI